MDQATCVGKRKSVFPQSNSAPGQSPKVWGYVGSSHEVSPSNADPREMAGAVPCVLAPVPPEGVCGSVSSGSFSDGPISFSARRCRCWAVSLTAAWMSTSRTVSSGAARSVLLVSPREPSGALWDGPPRLEKGSCGPLEQSRRLAQEMGGETCTGSGGWAPPWPSATPCEQGCGLVLSGRYLEEDGGQRGGAWPSPVLSVALPLG